MGRVLNVWYGLKAQRGEGGGSGGMHWKGTGCSVWVKALGEGIGVEGRVRVKVVGGRKVRAGSWYEKGSLNAWYMS